MRLTELKALLKMVRLPRKLLDNNIYKGHKGGGGGGCMAEEKKRLPRFVTLQDYGIGKARYEELRKIVKSGKHDDVVLSAALEADKRAARHIILAVKKELSSNT